MNAYELANYVADNGYIGTSTTHEVANMLRQQADRIAELEKLVHQRFDDGKRLGVLETENKFKSPPCAWMVKTNDGKKLMLYGEEQPPKFADEVQAIPLYTTPQTNNKNRSWSDICDEATAVWNSLDTSNQSNIECARAWFLEGYHQALTRGQE